MAKAASNSQVMNALRWVLVLPAAVLGYVCAYTVFFHLARWNLGLVMSNPEPIVPIFAGAAGAVGLLLVGSSVAPAFRGIVALVLLIADIAFVSGYSALHLAGLFSGRSLRTGMEVGLELAGNLLGAGVAFYLVFRAFGWRGAGPVSRIWREPSEYV